MAKITTRLFLLVILILASFPNNLVKAQAGSSYDLLEGVNSLRASKGLEPYQVDSFLMSYAQSHSEYMASLGYGTHTRADGSTAFSNGIQENVASGTNMSVNFCIYTIWSDYIHWKTMVDNASGSVGAGVAVSGDTVYYTLNVRPGNSPWGNQAGSVPVAAQPQSTLEYVNPVVTATPDTDGILIHIVQSGETLWAIAMAYGTTGQQILINSNLNPNSTDLYEGQRLIIKTAGPATETLQPTETLIPPTPTITPMRPTRTPMPTRTPAPTSTPTSEPPFIYKAFGDGKSLAYTLIGISGVGLVFILIFGFMKKPKS